jgi:sulfoxide reductase heme-binding subunit YedZ
MGPLPCMIGKAYRAMLLLPLLWWGYEISTGQYGADPAKTYNHATGDFALYYLLGNLFLGTLVGFGIRFPAWLRFLLLGRRFLGVVTFVFLGFHVFLYLAMEGFALQGFTQILTKLYLIFAFAAWLILFFLALTSNDFSLRLLGFRRWKFLHRFVHLAALFAMGHVLLIEKIDTVKFGSYFALLWMAQGTCFVWRKVKERRA